MSRLICLAASAARSASARTSEATTAKPLPASPARAASTPALSASRLVWNAISSMTPMIWPISAAERSDRVHRAHRVAHNLSAGLGVLVGDGDDFARAPRAIRRAPHGGADSFERGDDFGKVRRLLRRASASNSAAPLISPTPASIVRDAPTTASTRVFELVDRVVVISADLRKFVVKTLAKCMASGRQWPGP